MGKQSLRASRSNASGQLRPASLISKAQPNPIGNPHPRTSNSNRSALKPEPEDQGSTTQTLQIQALYAEIYASDFFYGLHFRFFVGLRALRLGCRDFQACLLVLLGFRLRPRPWMAALSVQAFRAVMLGLGFLEGLGFRVSFGLRV